MAFRQIDDNFEPINEQVLFQFGNDFSWGDIGPGGNGRRRLVPGELFIHWLSCMHGNLKPHYVTAAARSIQGLTEQQSKKNVNVEQRRRNR